MGMTDTLQETLAVFEGVGGTPLTTSEVAERLDLGRRSTYERLQRLVENDRLDTKKVGASGRVWWMPADAANRSGADGTGIDSLRDVVDDVDVGVFVLDDDFDVAWVNGTAERYFGLDRGEILGRDKRTLVEERIAPRVDDSEAFADTVVATYDDNTYTERFECCVTSPEDGVERWLEHRSKPIDVGTYAGGRVELYYEVTDRKHAEQALREGKEKFRTFVRSVDEYAIFMLDADGRVQTWNDGARRIKGYERSDILGEHISTFYTDDGVAAGRPERNLDEAAANGMYEEEGWRVRKDGTRFWARITLTAIRDDDGTLLGYTKVTRDLTDQRERKADLRRERDLLEQVMEVAPIGISVVGQDAELERMNERARELRGLSEGEHGRLNADDRTLRDADGEPVAFEDRPYARVMETGTSVTDWTAQLEFDDGESRWLSIDAAPILDDDGAVERVVTSAEDVTQLKEQAHRLERQRDDLRRELDDVYERVTDAVVALDDNWRFTYVNDRAEALFGVDGEDIYGSYIWDVCSESETASRRFRPEYERAMATQEPVTFVQYSDVADAWLEVRAYPSESGLSVYFRDVTERKRRERELERYETIVETVDDGIYAVDQQSRFVLVNDAFCEMTGYDREELIDTPATAVRDEEITSQAETLVSEMMTGDRDVSRLELDIETRGGDTIPVETRLAPFPMGDGQGRCGVIRDLSERLERERTLEAQRERLSALNNLNGIVRDIIEAVIQQSTREEIERTVCEALADADSYEFAWIAEADPATGEITRRVEAGVDGYFDGIPLSVDPDDPTGRGPAGRALHAKEVQVANDVFSDPEFEPWREQAREYGFQSTAAVPIVHDGILYDILGIYTDRERAFTKEERRMIAQLGEVIGHAIAAVERKRVLVSDEVVELEFKMDDALEARDVPAIDGTISFDRTVPVGDGVFLAYGTADDGALAAMESLVNSEEFPHWESLNVVGTDGEQAHFELRLSEPPAISTVASHGGYVDKAVIENGDYYMRLHLAPSANVHHVIDSIEQVYPDAEMVSRRQVTTDRSATPAQPPQLDSLTDRQQTAIEVAYHSGYFNWPRDTTGQEVASSLGVTPPTFHHHLRKGLNKILSDWFGESV